jgi:hypothetical protein
VDRQRGLTISENKRYEPVHITEEGSNPAQPASPSVEPAMLMYVGLESFAPELLLSAHTQPVQRGMMRNSSDKGNSLELTTG